MSIYTSILTGVMLSSQDKIFGKQRFSCHEKDLSGSNVFSPISALPGPGFLSNVNLPYKKVTSTLFPELLLCL